MIAVAVDLTAEELPKRAAPVEAFELASRCRVVVGKDGKVLKNNIGPGVTVGVTAEGDLHIVLAKAVVS